MCWLCENAANYNIDPDKICASGASTGGHLAAATGTLKLWDEPTENLSISSKPNLLLLNYPVYDNGPSGYGPTDFKAQYLTVSPLHNIDPTIPPCLVFLGTTVVYIPVVTAQLFQKKMKDVGVEWELILYQGAGHSIFSYQKGKSADYFSILNQSEVFLIQQGYISAANDLSTAIFTKKYCVYPNPASNYFQIMGTQVPNTAMLNDIHGKKFNVCAEQSGYNTNHIPVGIYLFSIENETYKLIVAL